MTSPIVTVGFRPPTLQTDCVTEACRPATIGVVDKTLSAAPIGPSSGTGRLCHVASRVEMTGSCGGT